MESVKGLVSFVSELRAARKTHLDEVRHIDAALAVLGKMSVGGDHMKPRHHRTMSAAARRKISLAQKARWAKANGQTTETKPKRHISAAGRKRIAAAARARWAKFRAAKK